MKTVLLFTLAFLENSLPCKGQSYESPLQSPITGGLPMLRTSNLFGSGNYASMAGSLLPSLFSSSIFPAGSPINSILSRNPFLAAHSVRASPISRFFGKPLFGDDYLSTQKEPDNSKPVYEPQNNHNDPRNVNRLPVNTGLNSFYSINPYADASHLLPGVPRYAGPSVLNASPFNLESPQPPKAHQDYKHVSTDYSPISPQHAPNNIYNSFPLSQNSYSENIFPAGVPTSAIQDKQHKQSQYVPTVFKEYSSPEHLSDYDYVTEREYNTPFIPKRLTSPYMPPLVKQSFIPTPVQSKPSINPDTYSISSQHYNYLPDDNLANSIDYSQQKFDSNPFYKYQPNSVQETTLRQDEPKMHFSHGLSQQSNLPILSQQPNSHLELYENPPQKESNYILPAKSVLMQDSSKTVLPNYNIVKTVPSKTQEPEGNQKFPNGEELVVYAGPLPAKQNSATQLDQSSLNNPNNLKSLSRSIYTDKNSEIPHVLSQEYVQNDPNSIQSLQAASSLPKSASEKPYNNVDYIYDASYPDSDSSLDQASLESKRNTNSYLTNPLPAETNEVTEDGHVQPIPLQDTAEGLKSPGAGFSCIGRTKGYYGDPDQNCKVFYICEETGKFSTFKCPESTIFNKANNVCDFPHQVTQPCN